MSLLRNREVKIMLAAISALSLIGVAVLAYVSTVAAVIGLIIAVLFIAGFLLFTGWRYQEIVKLAETVRRISSGDYALDPRDNEEGELSILKNEIYKMTRLLSEQSNVLKHDKDQLTDAISDISHQLKTPLTSMMVMADVLHDADLPEAKRKEFTRNIHIQLERMDWLVSSLLKLSKIEAGTIRFRRDQVHVNTMLAKALEPLLIPIEIKELDVTVAGDEETSFIGDLNWTTEALINILKNAVEHTREGGAIAIWFAENALFTEIIVKDEGKGMPKHELPYIFKRFYKGAHASENSIGIGLAMAYSIVKSQNGDIEVASEEGKGTEFRLKFYKHIV